MGLIGTNAAEPQPSTKEPSEQRMNLYSLCWDRVSDMNDFKVVK
jgi:hypothetical protein